MKGAPTRGHLEAKAPAHCSLVEPRRRYEKEEEGLGVYKVGNKCPMIILQDRIRRIVEDLFYIICLTMTK